MSDIVAPSGIVNTSDLVEDAQDPIALRQIQQAQEEAAQRAQSLQPLEQVQLPQPQPAAPQQDLATNLENAYATQTVPQSTQAPPQASTQEGTPGQASPQDVQGYQASEAVGLSPRQAVEQGNTLTAPGLAPAQALEQGVHLRPNGESTPLVGGNELLNEGTTTYNNNVEGLFKYNMSPTNPTQFEQVDETGLTEREVRDLTNQIRDAEDNVQAILRNAVAEENAMADRIGYTPDPDSVNMWNTPGSVTELAGRALLGLGMDNDRFNPLQLQWGQGRPGGLAGAVTWAGDAAFDSLITWQAEAGARRIAVAAQVNSDNETHREWARSFITRLEELSKTEEFARFSPAARSEAALEALERMSLAVQNDERVANTDLVLAHELIKEGANHTAMNDHLSNLLSDGEAFSIRGQRGMTGSVLAMHRGDEEVATDRQRAVDMLEHLPFYNWVNITPENFNNIPGWQQWMILQLDPTVRRDPIRYASWSFRTRLPLIIDAVTDVGSFVGGLQNLGRLFDARAGIKAVDVAAEAVDVTRPVAQQVDTVVRQSPADALRQQAPEDWVDMTPEDIEFLKPQVANEVAENVANGTFTRVDATRYIPDRVQLIEGGTIQEQLARQRNVNPAGRARPTTGANADEAALDVMTGVRREQQMEYTPRETDPLDDFADVDIPPVPEDVRLEMEGAPARNQNLGRIPDDVNLNPNSRPLPSTANQAPQAPVPVTAGELDSMTLGELHAYVVRQGYATRELTNYMGMSRQTLRKRIREVEARAASAARQAPEATPPRVSDSQARRQQIAEGVPEHQERVGEFAERNEEWLQRGQAAADEVVDTRTDRQFSEMLSGARPSTLSGETSLDKVAEEVRATTPDPRVQEGVELLDEMAPPVRRTVLTAERNDMLEYRPPSLRRGLAEQMNDTTGAVAAGLEDLTDAGFVEYVENLGAPQLRALGPTIPDLTNRPAVQVTELLPDGTEVRQLQLKPNDLEVHRLPQGLEYEDLEKAVDDLLAESDALMRSADPLDNRRGWLQHRLLQDRLARPDSTVEADFFRQHLPSTTRPPSLPLGPDEIRLQRLVDDSWDEMYVSMRDLDEISSMRRYLEETHGVVRKRIEGSYRVPPPPPRRPFDPTLDTTPLRQVAKELGVADYGDLAGARVFREYRGKISELEIVGPGSKPGFISTRNLETGRLRDVDLDGRSQLLIDPADDVLVAKANATRAVQPEGTYTYGPATPFSDIQADVNLPESTQYGRAYVLSRNKEVGDAMALSSRGRVAQQYTAASDTYLRAEGAVPAALRRRVGERIRSILSPALAELSPTALDRVVKRAERLVKNAPDMRTLFDLPEDLADQTSRKVSDWAVSASEIRRRMGAELSPSGYSGIMDGDNLFVVRPNDVSLVGSRNVAQDVNDISLANAKDVVARNIASQTKSSSLRKQADIAHSRSLAQQLDQAQGFERDALNEVRGRYSKWQDEVERLEATRMDEWDDWHARSVEEETDDLLDQFDEVYSYDPCIGNILGGDLF